MAKDTTRASKRRGNVNRGLKPRTADDYTNEEFGRDDSSLPSSEHTLNEKCCRITMIRPRWNEGPLVFRPFPALDYNDPGGNLQLGRTSSAERGQGQWIRRYAVANYIGTGGQDADYATFILYRPGDKAAKKRNPYIRLYYAAKTAHEEGEFGNGRAWNAKWNKLLKGGKGRGAALSAPNSKWYIQGAVYANGDKDYTEGDRDAPLGLEDGDNLVVIQLSGSAGEGLMELLDKQKKAYDGDAEKDPSLPYLYGDPCGVFNKETGCLEGGLFFHVFNPKKAGIKKGHPLLKHCTWDGGKLPEMPGYEVAITKRYKDESGTTHKASLTEDETNVIFDKWQFWTPDPDNESPDPSDGLLRIPSEEEQCLLIAKAFKSVPKLLTFAWADHPEFFTPEVMDILKQKSTTAMPGTADEYNEGDDFDNDDEDDEFSESTTQKDVTAPDLSDDEDEDDEFEDEDEGTTTSEDDEDDEDEFEDDDDDEGEEPEESDDEEEDEFDEETLPEETEETEDDDPPFDEDEDEDESGDNPLESYADSESDDEDEFAEEEESASAEFDPEAEATQAEEELDDSLAKATGRSGSRSSKKSTPPKKSTTKKKSSGGTASRKKTGTKTTKGAKAPAKKKTGTKATKGAKTKKGTKKKS